MNASCAKYWPTHFTDVSKLNIGRTDAETEAPILWPPDAKNWLTGKDPVAGKDWRWEEKGKTEDEMVGWHHQLDGHEFEQAPGDGEGQGSLACCSPWGRRESDMTEGLNWANLSLKEQSCEVGFPTVWPSKSVGSISTDPTNYRLKIFRTKKKLPESTKSKICMHWQLFYILFTLY